MRDFAFQPDSLVWAPVAPKKQKKGGRVTPKGGPAAARAGESKHHLPHIGHQEPSVQASTRYTPPVPQFKKHSAPWVPYVMFGLLGIGALVILLYYLGAVPGGRSNWYLAVGLAGVLGGLYTATKYH